MRFSRKILDSTAKSFYTYIYIYIYKLCYSVGRGCHLITEHIEKIEELSQFKVGLCHVLLLHTSASLTLNENWDPAVRYIYTTQSLHLVLVCKNRRTSTLWLYEMSVCYHLHGILTGSLTANYSWAMYTTFSAVIYILC